MQRDAMRVIHQGNTFLNLKYIVYAEREHLKLNSNLWLHGNQ